LISANKKDVRSQLTGLSATKSYQHTVSIRCSNACC